MHIKLHNSLFLIEPPTSPDETRKFILLLVLIDREATVFSNIMF